MAYNPKKYSALLSATLPCVIDSPDEYKRIEKVFNNLFKDSRSPEEDRLFNLLANLLEDYERRSLLPLKESSPLDTIKFLMEEKKMKQKDLLPLFNSEGVVSDILSGSRPITLKTARKLAEFLTIPVELFV